MPEVGARRDIVIDGIYFNPVEGVAGTIWPVGSPEYPVNNLADAVALMFAHNLKKLYLVGARTITGTHTAANHPTIMTDANNTFTPTKLIGLTIYNFTDGSSGVITANDEHTITVAALIGGGLNIWTTGDVYFVDALGNNPYRITFDQNVDLDLVGNGYYNVIVDPGIVVSFINGLVCGSLTNTTGTINIHGNCSALQGISNTTGIIEIFGNCYANNITQSDAGNINIYGDCHVICEINNSGTGTITIHGYCYTATISQNNIGTVVIQGNCHINNINNSNIGGTITVLGIAHIYGTIINVGTLTYKGVYPEVSVSINAINASETDFLNLVAIVGFHYTIDDLVLKCANPGVNTVNVRLYKLVNGVLTNTQTFAITAANFATYFDINTMFGLKSLAGDNIQITVQATAGGPYAVTGSYAYKSA